MIKQSFRFKMIHKKTTDITIKQHGIAGLLQYFTVFVFANICIMSGKNFDTA